MSPTDVALLASMAPNAVRGLLQSGEVIGERTEEGWAILPEDARKLIARQAKRDQE